MRIITALVALALAFSLAFSASAQQVHEVGVWISQPAINSTNELENLPLAFNLDEQTGFGVGSRRVFNNRWALSLDAIKVQADATLSDGDETVADLGKLSFVQIGAVAQLRLFRHAWVGAGAAYV
ncbi:MAG TPA: hypothetical protein VE010_01315, partial [Thermoanaerobaculia bacterium]|nr:hypothetical protein [Thermoanaerobaculia bacterium]